MKKLVVCLLVTGIIFSFSLEGKATDLKGKLGVGYSDLSPLSGWSIRYWLSDPLAVNGVIGFHFESDNSQFLFGGRIIYKVRDEQNLHLYLGGEVGADLRQNADDNFSVGPFVGVEYFFAGLPNLGFGAEIGAYYQSEVSAFATAFGGLAVHYYFGGGREVKKPKEKEEKPAPKPTKKK